MQKIGVLLIGVSIFAAAYAGQCKKRTDPCENYPTLKELDKCCYNLEQTSFDVAYDSCLAKFTEDGVQNPEYCASECAFEATEIVNPDKSINYDSLEALFEDQLKDCRLVDHMMSVVKDCEQQVGEMMQKPPYNVATGSCSPVANLMRRCTASHGILQCPIELWQMTPSCSEILSKTKVCPFKY